MAEEVGFPRDHPRSVDILAWVIPPLLLLAFVALLLIASHHGHPPQFSCWHSGTGQLCERIE